MTIYEDRFFKNSDSGDVFRSTTREFFAAGDLGDVTVSTNTQFPANFLIGDYTLDSTGRYNQGGLYLGVYRNLIIDPSVVVGTSDGRGVIILVRDTLTLNGTIDVDGIGMSDNGNGLDYVPAIPSISPAQGFAGTGPDSGNVGAQTRLSSGAGSGGYAPTSGTGGKGGGGKAVDSTFLRFLERASLAQYFTMFIGGADGGSGFVSVVNGGRGAGLVYIFASKIVAGAGSVITAKGKVGTSPEEGGGSGGFIAVAYKELIDSGLLLDVSGGDGVNGTGANGGIGGAGGVNTTANGLPTDGSDGTDGSGPAYPCGGGGGGGASGVILSRQLI